MRKTVATLLLIAACLGPSVVHADGMASKHWRVARGCGFEGRPYRDGEYCSLECALGSCTTQTCHHGRWVIPPATCPRAFGCPPYC
jgi:hypothetical protein